MKTLFGEGCRPSLILLGHKRKTRNHLEQVLEINNIRVMYFHFSTCIHERIRLSISNHFLSCLLTNIYTLYDLFTLLRITLHSI